MPGITGYKLTLPSILIYKNVQKVDTLAGPINQNDLENFIVRNYN